MNVLMFGWEFPPDSAGGLGTACYGITQGLNEQGINVTLVLPRQSSTNHDFVKIVSTDNTTLKIRGVNSLLLPYMTMEEYHEKILSMREKGIENLYGKNLFDEVYKYGRKAALIAAQEPHDVIHAHEWLTFQAGIEARKISGKPLIVHVHATEFDRTGGNGVNQYVYDLEKKGMQEADLVIAVSNYTKSLIVKHYDIAAEKIKVVHNAVEQKIYNPIVKRGKTVLFLGRITLQKGPDYFLYAAKRVSEYEPDARFIMAGNGDMFPYIIEKSAELGIGDKVLFTGFVRPNETSNAYKMADVFVMPSVSEPFGITALEAQMQGVPVIISKQSGVSEVINHCIKVDFWDVNQLANKIIGILRYKEAGELLSTNGMYEVKKITWENSAGQIANIYRDIVADKVLMVTNG